MADEEMEGSLLDLSDRGLTRLELPQGETPTALIADRNSIARVENLEQCPYMRQLSLKSNRLVHMGGVSKLRHLTVLNLPQNSIIAIEGLKELAELAWLNLSGNSIKMIDNLSNNMSLKHLDLSDNSIALLGDIHHLFCLKTLLLHGNMLTSLKVAPHFLPKSLNILSLAENELGDINEVSYLSCLPELQQLSVMNNPCVLMTASAPGFDYRPFIVNWCPNLQILDGYSVSEKETLKAEWLYSQGKGHHFKVGQHVDTVRYLSNVCPLTASIQLESAEDAKLSHILSKQRYHQQQLQQQRPSQQQQQQQQQHWNIPTKQSPQAGGDNSNVTESGSPSQPPNSRQPVRAWSVHADTSVSSGTSHHDRQGQHLNDLSVQDITSEDYDKRSSCSMLDSESMYLPVEQAKSPTSPNSRPMTAPAVTLLSQPITQNVFDILTRGENRPATAIGDNKYDAYDKRPIKPLNQDIYKGYKPDFNVSKPQISGTGPQPGAKKSVPPTALAMDCDTSQELSQMDDAKKENVKNIPTQDLHLIRDAALKKQKQTSSSSHKTRPDHSKSVKVTDKKRDKVDSGRTTSGTTKTSIPVAKSTVSRTQSEYVPGKYSGSRRPGTADSVRTIRTIPERSLGSDRTHHKANSKPEHTAVDTLADSGIYSRPPSDAVLTEDVKAAATKIQSFWRGYYTREHNVDAVRVRREIRARRAEEHIVVLRSELDKQRKLYEQERQLRTLQLEAIRHLWREVQSLQTWKSEVLQTQTFSSTETRREQEYNSYNSSLEIQNTLARAEMLNKMGDNFATHTGGHHTAHTAGSAGHATIDPGKQVELERTCASLQTQVASLSEALKSVTTIVSQTSGSTQGSTQGSMAGSLPVTPRSVSSLNTTGNTNKEETEVMVRGDFEDWVESGDSPTGTRWGTVPHSISPYPSEEEETYFKSVPHPGFPTPPRGLRLENRGPSALVLRWQASKVLDSDNRETSKPLLGYRVFVNDKPKAMIAGTKQKALIEGLDATLTYKIYVKAVSDLGESNSSDIVMAALSKGSRRRSSSSDSNRSYDSDRESTESERRHSHRKDSRKNRKTKSPRSKGERSEKKESSHKESNNRTQERPVSRQEGSMEGIMTQPKLHTHRRTRSKDYQNKTIDENLNNLRPKETPKSPVQRSAKLSSQESQGFSFDGRGKSEVVENSGADLSSTFTVDSQNSVLLAISRNMDDSADSRDDGAPPKGHRRRRSKDLKQDKFEVRGDISDSSSSVSSVNMLRKNFEAAEKSLSGTDSPSVQRRRKARDSAGDDSDSASRRNSAKISPTAGSQGQPGVPVIDGRRRHGSGSRPSSPAHSDISDTRSSVTASDRRRLPMADILEQKFSSSRGGGSGAGQSSTASSTATLTQSQVDASQSDLPPPIPRRDGKYSSLENLSTRSSHEYNRSPTERYSPTSSERRRTSSTCSESDIPSPSTAARQLDMDNKPSGSSSSNGGIVAKLLHKLQTFSKTQEESLRTTKIKRKSEVDETPRKASGDSDSSEAMAPGNPPSHSDSGAHSDDSQQVTRPSYRTHRRTASDHRGVIVKSSDQRPPSPSSSSSSHRVSDHSPVIMDSSKPSAGPPGSSSTSAANNNIKRHASFHGILPSKKEDLVRSGSTENINEKTSPTIKQQNIDAGVPTTPTRRHRHRSRSRSPGPSPPHVPIISAAQLQRQNKLSSTPS